MGHRLVVWRSTSRNLYLRTVENVGKLAREQTYARSECFRRVPDVGKKFPWLLQLVPSSKHRSIFNISPETPRRDDEATVELSVVSYDENLFSANGRRKTSVIRWKKGSKRFPLPRSRRFATIFPKMDPRWITPWSVSGDVSFHDFNYVHPSSRIARIEGITGDVHRHTRFIQTHSQSWTKILTSVICEQLCVSVRLIYSSFDGV